MTSFGGTGARIVARGAGSVAARPATRASACAAPAGESDAVVNLFAWRATDPAELEVAITAHTVAEEIGTENTLAILDVRMKARRPGLCALGDRDAISGRATMVIGHTKSDPPRHALRRALDTPLLPLEAR